MKSVSKTFGKISGKISGPNNAYSLVLFSAVAATAAVFVISVSVGIYSVPFSDVVKITVSRFIPGIEPTWTAQAAVAVNHIRLPRTVASLLTGSGLAVAGAAYQSMFKNPMVSPDILGVSAGASVGAAMAILVSSKIIWIEAGAFAGGLAAVAVTMAIPRIIKNDSIIILILGGIIVGSLANSVMSVIRMMADPATTLADITYWTMGSFTRAKMSELAFIAPVMLICIVFFVLSRYRLNVMSLGENEAKTLGVDIRRQRTAIIAFSTLLTACSVSIAGTVGWVGLVIPHITRMLTGPDNKKMLPVTVFLGGIFMMLIDMLARTLTVMEIPVSVLTGVIGSPIFFTVLLKQRRSLR
jgi:iron complex transport system permease protein